MQLRICLALFASILVGTGCSSEPKKGIVSGTITLDEKPLANASISIVSPDGTTVAGQSDVNGYYRISDVIVGDVKIGVVMPTDGEDGGESIKRSGAANPQDKAKAAAKAKSGPATKIPTRYSDPLTSGLTHKATEGETTFPIKLTSK